MKWITDHPRFAQRMQALGFFLLALGMTTHARGHSTLLTACILLSLLMLGRVVIEWTISGSEPEDVLESRFRRISIINQMSLMAILFGAVGYMRER